jgi:glutaredoxin 3
MSRTVRRLALVLVLMLPVGCDAVREKVSALLIGGAGGPAQAPAGWQSIEGAEAARRLYYQFVDAAGQVRFVERIEEVPEECRDSVGFVKLDVAPPLSPAAARRARDTQLARRGGARGPAGASAAAGGAPRVVVYYADWCGACRKAKRYLSRKGVPFEARNVDDPAVAAELRGKTGARSIPVIDVDGRILTGFSPAALDALLDRA